MSHSRIEEDEQFAIKAIQRQFEAMNKHLARNETSDTHKRQPHKRVQTSLEDEDERWYSEYEEN